MLVVVVAGIIGGVALAGLTSLVFVLKKSKTTSLYFMLALFLITFILAANFDGVFAFAQNLRFVILGIILVLLNQKIFIHNKALSLSLFTIYALVVTYFISDFGASALLRCMGFLVVALCTFKLVELLLKENRALTLNLIVNVFFVFFLINILLYFIPIYKDVFILNRFKGLMGNPNELALLAVFSYVLIHWISQYETTQYSKRFFKIFKLIIFMIIIFSGSRTSLITIAIFEVTLLFFSNIILFTISFISLLLLGFYINSSNFVELILSIGLESYMRVETLDNFGGRLEVWEVAYEEFLIQPWLGHGMTYDDYYIKDYALNKYGDNYARQWNGVWSSYLSLGLNVGIIGSLFYAFFWFKLFKSSREKIFRTAFLLTMLSTAVTEPWLMASMNAFMPVVFLIWILQIYAPVNIKTKKS